MDANTPDISIEAFAEWAEKQPANEWYDYGDPYRCAFGQFLRTAGIMDPVVSQTGWRDILVSNDRGNLPVGVNYAVSKRPWNFAALATRLRTHIAGGERP